MQLSSETFILFPIVFNIGLQWASNDLLAWHLAVNLGSKFISSFLPV